MIDDLNIIVQRDPSNALGVAGDEWKQATFQAEIISPDHDNREIKNIIIAGMGGSALAALIAKKWLQSEISQSLEIIRDYHLPKSVNKNTLVIASSYSGNTEETVSALYEALTQDAQIATISAHGKLEEIANRKDIAHVKLPSGLQPRMAVIYNLRALIKLLVAFDIVGPEKYDEIEQSANFLREETKNWLARVPSDVNLAKQIALYAAGRSGVFLSSSDMSPVAYKWKISWNENAKNVSFWNEYPEFNHNEFIGWSSHPIEKPFAVVEIRSNLEHERVQKRFEVSERLLSGMRPAPIVVEPQGETLLQQLAWSFALGDFVSIYLAVLNGVNPTPVELVEKLKKELG